MAKLDRLSLPAGITIQWQGIPFILTENTPVLGKAANWEVANKLEKQEEKREETESTPF